MMSVQAEATGTAAVQGTLWGVRARDWAEIQERMVLPLYEGAFDRTGVRAGTKLLDAGCGAGIACLIAAKRGADVTGLDATAAFIAIARERTPRGDFRVGEIEELPYADDTFDVITGFNSFQYAANPVRALREARRVAKPGAYVVIATWGLPEQCQAVATLAALAPLLPPPPPNAPGPFALSVPGALEALATQAGLASVEAADADCPWLYADRETALRGLLSSGPVIKAIQIAGEEAVRRATADALIPFRTVSGGYRLENVFRYLIATA